MLVHKAVLWHGRLDPVALTRSALRVVQIRVRVEISSFGDLLRRLGSEILT